MPSINVPSNSFGLTKCMVWDDLASSSPQLLEQLEKAKVVFEKSELPHIVGMGGNAYLVSYVSPKTSLPVTVLCVPHRDDIDSWYEEYFYFEGLQKDSVSEDKWIDLYDECRTLVYGVSRRH